VSLAEIRELLHDAYRAGYWAACDYHRIDDDTVYPSEIDRWIDNNLVLPDIAVGEGE